MFTLNNYFRDVKCHSLLKIREQNRNFQSPPPIRFVEHSSLNTSIDGKSNPIVDYISEPEMNYTNDRNRNYYPRSARLLRNNGVATELRTTTPSLNGSINEKNYLIAKRPLMMRSPLSHQQENQRELRSPIITSNGVKPNQYFGTSIELMSNSNINSSNASVTSYDPFYDPYYSSDSASRHSRSNSSTPISMQQQKILVFNFCI